MIDVPGLAASRTGPSGPVCIFIGCFLLIAAPLIRGGNRHVALVILEVLALLLLLILVSHWVFRLMNAADPISGTEAKLPVSVFFLALSPLGIGILQLTPLPPFIQAVLPGQDIYQAALHALPTGLDHWRPLSVIPDATWLSVLAGLPLTAAFLMGYSVAQRQLVFLIQALVLLVSTQAVLGLMQASLFRELYFGAQAYGRAIGTFANPNHLANYISMVLPLTIFMMRLAARRRSSRGDQGGVTRGRSKSEMKGQNWRSIIPSFLLGMLFLQLAALLATLSRAGLGVGLFVTLLAVLFVPLAETRGRGIGSRVLVILIFCAVVAASVGLGGLLDRIGGAGDQSTRWLMYEGAWQAALAFWPTGSGLGTFLGVFPRYQPQQLAGFAADAHSDFLQLLMECGLFFVIPAGVALWLIASRAVAVARCLKSDPSDTVLALQASCGLGLLAVFLHSWVDFNLRIPANAILAAFLMGAFLRPLALKKSARTEAPGTLHPA